MSQRQNPNWSHEEDAVLIRMAHEGASTKEIADALERRSPSGVERRRRVLKLPLPLNPRSWTDNEERLLKKYWEEGFTLSEIGKKLNRSPKACRERRVVMGLPPRKPGRAPAGYHNGNLLNRPTSAWVSRMSLFGRTWTLEEHHTLKTMWEEGASIRAIARKLNRSRSAVERRKRDLGLQPRHIRNRTEPNVEELTGRFWKSMVRKGMDKFEEALTRSGLQFEDSPRAIKTDARRLRQSDFEHYVEKAA